MGVLSSSNSQIKNISNVCLCKPDTEMFSVFPTKILAGNFPYSHGPYVWYICVLVVCLKHKEAGVRPRIGSLTRPSDHGSITVLSTWILLSNYQRT